MADHIEILNQMLLIEDKFARDFNAVRTSGNLSDQQLVEKMKESIELALDFIRKKEQIREKFVEDSALVIRPKRLRNLMEKISSNQDFLADRIVRSFEKLSGLNFRLSSLHPDTCDFDQLDEAALEKMASEELYSWWGPYDYIWGLVEIGILVTGVPIPANLKKYLEEARQCYAFKQYNAVFSLCRTILEAGMRDVGLRRGRIRPIQDTKEFFWEYPPRTLIRMTTRGRVRERVHDFYTEMSGVIHGSRTIKAEKARAALKETIGIIQSIYGDLG